MSSFPYYNPHPPLINDFTKPESHNWRFRLMRSADMMAVPGDIQRMSPGTGIQHSEMNTSDKDSAHFLQIWLQPNKVGHSTSYEQIKLLDNVGMKGSLHPLSNPEGVKVR